MPMYWQGFYAPSGGLPHLQQSPLLRPSLGLPVPPSLQQPLQYPGMNAILHSGSLNLSELTPSLLPPASSMSLTSITLPSTVAPTQASVLAPETATTLISKRPLVDSLPATALGAHLPFLHPLTSSHDPAITTQNMTSAVSSNQMTACAPTLAYQTMSQAVPSMAGLSSQNQVESAGGLVISGQLVRPGPSILTSSEPLQASLKNVEVKPQDAKIKPSLHAPPTRAAAVAKEPILPLPKPFHHKPNRAALQNHDYNRVENHYYNQGRGRGRGRGNGYSRLVAQFTEDFDFMAMNEKFKKDEVWGHLGKNKDPSLDTVDTEREVKDDGDEDGQEENDSESLKIKPIYIKDDFFDTLSCKTLDHRNRGWRTKFSEQLKIDADTFGDFPRHRSAWGGGRGFRGGGRGRGPHSGRGYGYQGVLVSSFSRKDGKH